MSAHLRTQVWARRASVRPRKTYGLRPLWRSKLAARSNRGRRAGPNQQERPQGALESILALVCHYRAPVNRSVPTRASSIRCFLPPFVVNSTPFGSTDRSAADSRTAGRRGRGLPIARRRLARDWLASGVRDNLGPQVPERSAAAPSRTASGVPLRGAGAPASLPARLLSSGHPLQLGSGLDLVLR
jgi:hypothetical protein